MSHYNVLISLFLLWNTTVINTVNTFLFRQANCGILRSFRLDRTSRSCWWAALNSTIFPRQLLALLWHGPAPSAPSVVAPVDSDWCGLSSFKQPLCWSSTTKSYSKHRGPGNLLSKDRGAEHSTSAFSASPITKPPTLFSHSSVFLSLILSLLMWQ